MVSQLTSLRFALSEFDGRALTVLGETAAKFQNQSRFLKNLVVLSSDADEHVSSGATWILKSRFEAGDRLTAQNSRLLFSNIGKIQNWAAQLLICQSAAYFRPDAKSAGQFVQWLTERLDHERPFIRAWSLDALCRMARQYPEHAIKAEQALEQAANDPAGSVKARIRNINSETHL